MKRLAILLIATLAAGPALAQARITEADARAFVARQTDAWNAGDLDRYFAGFTAEARFTDQAYVGDKPPVPYGTSTLAEARTQAQRSLARGRSREAVEVRSVAIAPDGRSAHVRSRVGALVIRGGKTRRLCASRAQTLTLAGGRLRSGGQTDTYVKCRDR